MSEPDEKLHPDAADEDGGGPVKSFLEHLEDLRWVLIKILATVGVAFVVCLVAGNWVVAVLDRPLKKAPVRFAKENQVVTFLFGSNRLGVFQLPPDQRRQLDLGTNQFVTLHLQPIAVGTNVVLGFRADADPTEASQLGVPLVSLSPAGAFIVAVQVAMYAAVVVSMPFILYYIAAFVFPALKWKERKYIFKGLFIGLGLFLSGILFCYFFLLPISLTASVAYTNWLGFSVPQWRAEDYISFICKFMLGMGLGFEMPVVLLVLVKIGILNYTSLARARRYVIVLCFFLGAVLTTPEIITQVLMAFPLMGLYEISVWIAWYWEQEDRARARRRLALVLGVIVLSGCSLWFGYRYGLPWLQAHEWLNRH
jgi:sec-independent protein translocase protein TatC